jgi:hypothetical protein
MSFLEIINQVIALLRTRGRISYRILKREFALDDEALQDLKDQLIEADRVAVDEDGKVLVWVGEGSLGSRVQRRESEEPGRTSPAQTLD